MCNGFCPLVCDTLPWTDFALEYPLLINVLRKCCLKKPQANHRFQLYLIFFPHALCTLRVLFKERNRSFLGLVIEIHNSEIGYDPFWLFQFTALLPWWTMNFDLCIHLQLWWWLHPFLCIGTFVFTSKSMRCEWQFPAIAALNLCLILQ